MRRSVDALVEKNEEKTHDKEEWWMGGNEKSQLNRGFFGCLRVYYVRDSLAGLFCLCIISLN